MKTPQVTIFIIVLVVLAMLWKTNKLQSIMGVFKK